MGNWIVPSIERPAPVRRGRLRGGVDRRDAPRGSSRGPAQPYSILQGSKTGTWRSVWSNTCVSDKKAVSASLASEGNFRQGFRTRAARYNREVAAITTPLPAS
ncbi:hypothetical protein GCM10020220_090100 [Nonomuraea rubra]